MLIGIVTYNQFAEILKLTFVEQAKKHIEKSTSGTKLTKSELSLLTGIDSRNFPTDEVIENILHEFSLEDLPIAMEDLLYPESSILGLWNDELHYLTPQFKKKKIIPIRGKNHSFESYVRKFYTRGVTVQSVLKRLINNGNVNLVSPDLVQLKKVLYVPIELDKEEILKVGLTNLLHLASTISHNVMADSDSQKHFQRIIRANTTLSEDFSAPKGIINKKLSSQLEAMLQLIRKHEKQESSSGQSFWGVGYYYFEQDQNKN
jgi:hypothetical protein